MENKREILKPSQVIEQSGQIITFKHSINCGDLIYSLPGIRAVCRKNNAKARIYCGIDWTGNYDNPHPLGNRLFTEDSFRIMAPLIEPLEFIDSFEIWQNQCQIDFNLDEIRDHNEALGMPHTEIRQWIMMYFPELAGDISEPWIPKASKKASFDYIAVNFTERYRNKLINYKFLQDLDIPILFLGVPKEHTFFIPQVRKAQYIPTKDYAQVASVIGGSKLFIGNQSSCFAVAEGMGHPRLLEIDRNATNVIPCTPNGVPFVDQKALEYLVNEAIK
jgi:hypothetical protein